MTKKDCVRFAPMIGAREGELSEVEARALAAHLAMCRRCQELAARFARTDGLVAEALLARANARDFAPFVDQVMDRIGTGAPQGARSGRGLLGWVGRHWKGTLSVTAPALAALAVFMYVHFGGPGQVASLEISSQGVSTVLQTSDGPVVLLPPEEHPS
ncbi:anti-sigma factor family protein [Anaeromyxobacter oryzisoli]|uniref:anti-sigma factor family protein n=1 Tax=Anaeromyxobacter oryzisoli TaxID=2925408 RepID=UPI001F56EBCB|nr:zf-HC2 domain-containing protein [Anaeromyxobacter sp. SG63]